MKTFPQCSFIFLYLLLCITFNKDVFGLESGLGSELEFGLDSRGGIVLSSAPREREAIDFYQLSALRGSVEGVLLRSEREEVRQLGSEMARNWLSLTPATTDQERVQLANTLRQQMITLRDDFPEIFNEVQRLEQERRGYQFTDASLPDYCENYPAISSDDLEIFYSHTETVGGTCFRNIGEHIVNNDIGHVSEVMRQIQGEALDPQLREFRSQMMGEVARGILDQRGIYGGLSGTAESLYPSCFPTATRRRPQVNPRYNHETFQSSFNESFQQAREEREQSPVERESLLRSSLSSILYQEALRIYQNEALPSPIIAATPEAFHCQTITALRHGLTPGQNLSFQESDVRTICHSQELHLTFFDTHEQCVEAHQSYFGGSLQSEYETCLRESSDNTTHLNSREVGQRILRDQIEQAPLLFTRTRDGLGREAPSPMARHLKDLPGMRELLRDILPEMQGGLESFNQNFDSLIQEHGEDFERIFQNAKNSEEVAQVIDSEISDYQAALDTSLNDMCENGGENLHHIPELVETVREQMVNRGGDETSREEALVRSQNMECYLLREFPPSHDGQIHPALYYLGIAGGIAVSFANPLLGSALLVGIEVVNGVSNISTRRGQYEEILASAHAGFSDRERAAEARSAYTGAIVQTGAAIALELAGAGVTLRTTREASSLAPPPRGGGGIRAGEAVEDSRILSGSGSSSFFSPIQRSDEIRITDIYRLQQETETSLRQIEGLEFSPVDPRRGIHTYTHEAFVNGWYGQRYIPDTNNPEGQWFMGRLLNIDQVPPAHATGNYFTPFMNHPEFASTLERLRGMGYDVVIDPTNSLVGAGAYYNPIGQPGRRYIGMGANSNWGTFLHELQHLEFDHVTRNHWPSFENAARGSGPSMIEVLSPEEVQTLGLERIQRIEDLLSRGHTNRGIDETLSTELEARVLVQENGWRAYFPGTQSGRRRNLALAYGARNRVEGLRNINGDLSSAQRLELLLSQASAIGHSPQVGDVVAGATIGTGIAAGLGGAAIGSYHLTAYFVNEDDGTIILRDNEGQWHSIRKPASNAP